MLSSMYMYIITSVIGDADGIWPCPAQILSAGDLTAAVVAKWYIFSYII